MKSLLVPGANVVFLLFITTFNYKPATTTPLVGYHDLDSGAEQQLDENFNNLASSVDERSYDELQSDVLSQSVRGGADGNATCGKVFVAPVFSGAFIVGGQRAKPHSWPWQCRLVTDIGNGYISLCGASVVSRNHLVTAAHCVVRDGLQTEESKLSVVCGDNSRQIQEDGEEHRSVSRITVHESYNLRPYDSDLAILRLDTPLTFNKYVQPICLPTEDVPADTECVVTGWGRTSSGANGRTSDTLQQVTLPIVSQSDCSKRWGNYLTDNMLCAGYTEGGKSSCQGDSGGPLVCNVGGHWLLHGVVSWGHRNCDQPNYPSVFARTTHFGAWIQKAIIAGLTMKKIASLAVLKVTCPAPPCA